MAPVALLFFFASLVNDVRDLIARHDLAGAERAARSYQSEKGNTSELAAAVSHSGTLGACDDNDEFTFALDLLLDGLERRRVAESGA